MPKSQSFQSNFTSGVLDPKLKSRVDITHYFNGVEVGDNVMVGPHGGLRRRPGTRFMHEVPVSVAGDCVLAAFSYNSTDQQYLILFANLRLYFYNNGVLLTNINGSGLDYLVSPWPLAVLREVKWAQSGDTMIIVHEDYAPQILVRGVSHTSWNLSALTFDYVPQVDYNDALSPTPTSEEQDVTFTTFSVGNTFKLDLEGVLTENITYDTVTATLAARIARAVGLLYNTGSGEVTCVFQAGTTYRVQFNGGAARNYNRMTGFATTGGGTIGVADVATGVTRRENVWGSTRGYPRTVTFFENRLIFGGTRSKPQTIFMSVTNDFYNFDLGQALEDDAIQRTLDTDQVNTIQSVVGSGRHLQVYTEGGEFYCPDSPMTPEKSSFKPQTQHGSPMIDPGSVDGATLFLDRYGRGLYQFVYDDVEASYTSTSLSRLAAHLLQDPVDMAFQLPSSDEDTNYVYIVCGDGSIALLNTLRSEEIAGWSRWITDGVFLSVAVLAERGFVLVQRTKGDGTAAWFVEELDFDYYNDCAVRASPTPVTVNVADVRLVQVGGPYSTLYYRYVDCVAAHGLSVGDVIEITGVNATKYHDVNGIHTVYQVTDTDTIRLTNVTVSGHPGNYIDGGVVSVGTGTTLAGLSHLNGLLCRVLENGAVANSKTPTAGSIALDTEATVAEVGLNFTPLIRTMPPALKFPGVDMQLGRTRYRRVRANVKSTQGMMINGYPMPERYMDSDPLDAAPAALTGVFEIPLAGWGELPGLEITQQDPLPMTLLAIEAEVEMH